VLYHSLSFGEDLITAASAPARSELLQRTKNVTAFPLYEDMNSYQFCAYFLNSRAPMGMMVETAIAKI
jgi:hypothetical protein